MRTFVISVLLELAGGCSAVAGRGLGAALGGLAFTVVAVYGFTRIDNRSRVRG